MKKHCFLVVCPVAAALLIAFGSPAYAASSCSFGAHGLSMAFGNLNPSVAGNVTVNATPATLNANTWGNCGNASQTMVMSATTGLHSGSCPGGGTCMANGADLIPYSLTLAANAKASANGYIAFTVTGTVLGSAYVNAPAGSYSDSVLLTVNP